MIRNTLFLFLCALVLSVVNGDNAFASEVKDSYYFMKDDGEFSDEEKDEEAQYIFETCGSNAFQKLYFDCACIAGAFRQERDKEDLIPQAILLNSLYKDNERGCANTVILAGETYEFCQNYAKTFRYREKNNNEYCECVANKTANDFTNDPYLSLRHIENIKTDAMISCNREF